ncbi:MAG: hypothetical protein ACYCUK_01940 [Thiomonas sp.]
MTRLQEIEDTLRELRQLLREDQPKKDGVVLLELADCGKKCLGCPHVRWKQWRWHPRNKRHPWQAHPVPFPLRKLRRTGIFAASFPLASSRIRQVLELSAERERLVRRLHDLRRTLGPFGPPKGR